MFSLDSTLLLGSVASDFFLAICLYQLSHFLICRFSFLRFFGYSCHFMCSFFVMTDVFDCFNSSLFLVSTNMISL